MSKTQPISSKPSAVSQALWRDRHAMAAILPTGIVAMAVLHYNTLLGVPSGAVAAWALAASYAVVALIGAAWGLILKARRPRTYSTIGLGTHSVTSQVTVSGYEVRS
jgi:hypothetical protein